MYSNKKLTSSPVSGTYRPVVLLHGILGSKEDMVDVVAWIQKDFPGIHVFNAEVGNGFYDRLILFLFAS
ncbi:hypothetical protein M1146_08065 [Patescibacteria group bacterium]|nr:hypothetical protein [Patescibacteria group bacterium]